jgi:glycosyltransferase involved in cell wall biosynthesis
LNIGIKNASGEIIVRMDAHATYQNDYISKCVKYLYEYNADNVGGIMVTLPFAGYSYC